LAKDARNNIAAPVYESSEEGIFAAGDARRGQSLIVWAINEGRQAARMADRYLRAKAPAPIQSGNVHDADFGPEGPPQHVSGALVAEE
jgi:glutamate synthase (NADPH) small chain